MDSSSNKAALPRLSKLPLPRTGPALRTAASRESLISAPAETRSTRLRQSASRDQIAAASRPGTAASVRSATDRSTSTFGQRPKPAPSLGTRKPAERPASISSRSNTRAVSTPTGDRDRARQALLRNPTIKEAHDEDVSARDQLLFKKKSTVLTRRPSDTWGKSPYVPPVGSTPPGRPSNGTRVPSSSQVSPIQSSSRDHSASSNGHRPSLAERTAETLQQVAFSPGLRRQASSFFDNGLLSPARDRTGSRPTSRQSSIGDPTSPLGHRISAKPPSQPRTAKPPPISGSAPHALRPAKTRQSLGASSNGSSSTDDSASTFNTLPARPLKTRASVNGLFRQPSLQNMKNPYDSPRRVSSVSLKSPLKTIPSQAALKTTSEREENKVQKSSMALRDQIAAARAAARKAAATPTPSQPEPEQAEEHQAPSSPTPIRKVGRTRTGTIVHVGRVIDYDDTISDDPFNQRRTQGAKNKMLIGRLEEARGNGRLNIAAMGLKTIPAEVLRMYDISMLGEGAGAWGESVDLTRFVAADNEIESIGEDIFPDKDLNDYSVDDDDDSPPNIFGGLETLDLHGNILISAPIGLRRLTHLTSLNLSHNRISNDSLDIISQITSLRDLKLAKNLLYGPLPASFSNLINLEVLDIKANNVSGLPADIAKMNRLRLLNLSENSFESLPFAGLSKLPLTEINASKNKIAGVLIAGEVSCMPLMQILDLSCNKITHLVPEDSQISFPSLHQLTLSVNKLKRLPNMVTWTNLMTLAVDENTIAEIPEGFTSLMKLRHVDFSSNDVRIIPPEVSAMDSLMMIRLSGNPLRDKKFSTITTEELKDILSARLEPPPAYHTINPNPSSNAVPAQDVKRADSPDTVIGPEDAPSPVEQVRTPERVVSRPEPTSGSAQNTERFPSPPPIPEDSPSFAHTFNHQDVAVRSRSHTMSSQQNWPVKTGGILDRSRTESSSLHPVVCSKIAATNKIREAQLHHNLFSTFPEALSFFADTLTQLSLSHNLMVGEAYLTEMLELPALKELNIMSNKITSLVPLTVYLHAPELDKIDASMNRLNSLPAGLRSAFPKLSVLQVSNNHITDLEPTTIAGMRIVDVSNNDIAHLNPRLGLLGGSVGLQQLEVTGNRFRVPRWNVLERGTEATLRWLRGRVPVAEKAAWREQNSDENGSDPDLD